MYPTGSNPAGYVATIHSGGKVISEHFFQPIYTTLGNRLLVHSAWFDSKRRYIFKKG